MKVDINYLESSEVLRKVAFNDWNINDRAKHYWCEERFINCYE